MKQMLLTALLGLVLVCTPARADPPPLSAFARMPGIEQAAISPDGTLVALLGGPPGERTLFLAPVDGANSVTARLGQAWVHEVRWISNDYLVVNFSMLDKGTDYSSGRNWMYALNRNVVIDRNGKLVASLLANTEWSRWAISQPVIAVFDTPKPSVLVQGLDMSVAVRTGSADSWIERTADELVAALWLVDAATGDAKIVVKGGPYTRSWDVDLAGEPRLRFDYEAATEDVNYYARPKGASSWVRLPLVQTDEREQAILGYSEPDDAVYIEEQRPDGAHLLRRPLAGGEAVEMTLTAPASALGLQWDLARNMPVAIVTAGERPAYQWLDAQLGAVHGKLARAFAGRDVSLVSWSKDRTRIVVRAEAPASPPAFFLFDTKTNQASALGDAYPELAGATFGKTSWLTYKARDGLEIPAYLTLPPGHVEGTRLPLVVMPHGGPAARDDFGFDWWVQAIASRGYAVLQPQFRGSAGFGWTFQKAGHREWGGKMQEDLIDGMLALEARGVIDPKRVCIVGASYGGYAALFGATVYPSAYRCAVSVNGVSDLALFYGSKARDYGRDTALVNSLETMMGNPRNEPEAYRIASPVFRVTPRTSPILLVHGEYDTTVPILQSQTMHRALREAGFTVELITLKADDHHLSSTASRLQMLEATMAFLARHNPTGGQ